MNHSNQPFAEDRSVKRSETTTCRAGKERLFSVILTSIVLLLLFPACSRKKHLQKRGTTTFKKESARFRTKTAGAENRKQKYEENMYEEQQTEDRFRQRPEKAVSFSTGRNNKELHDDYSTLTKPLEKRLLESAEEMSAVEEYEAQHSDSSDPEKNWRLEDRLAETVELDEDVARRVSIDENEIDFVVQNLTGKKIYVTCFSYIKKRPLESWRWDKSEIYELNDKEYAVIDIDYIPDEQTRKNVYGYLGVFDTLDEADEAIYELLPDDKKIDLDLLYKLKGKKVAIGIEKYGFKNRLIDCATKKLIKESGKIPELDFVVENQTPKTVIVACFIYERKSSQGVWKYDKAPLVTLAPGEIGIIDVDTLADKYDRVYARGQLAVFLEEERKMAETVTYELVPDGRRTDIGRLMLLRNKKIVLTVERYGVLGDYIDFTVKPVRRIDFKKLHKKL